MVRYTADLVRSLWWETSQVKRDLDGGLTLEDVFPLFHDRHPEHGTKGVRSKHHELRKASEAAQEQGLPTFVVTAKGNERVLLDVHPQAAPVQERAHMPSHPSPEHWALECIRRSPEPEMGSGSGVQQASSTCLQPDPSPRSKRPRSGDVPQSSSMNMDLPQSSIMDADIAGAPTLSAAMDPGSSRHPMLLGSDSSQGGWQGGSTQRQHDATHERHGGRENTGPDLLRRLPNLSHPPEVPGQLAGTPDGQAASTSPDDESLEQAFQRQTLRESPRDDNELARKCTIDMDVSDMVIGVGLNPNPGKEPHTILAKLWRKNAGDDIANLNGKKTLDPFADIEQRLFQKLSGSRVELSQQQLREQKQQLKEKAATFFQQPRSVMVAEVLRLKALCIDDQVDAQLNTRCKCFIRNEFQPGWGREHKHSGIEQFQSVRKQHPALPPNYSWYTFKHTHDKKVTRTDRLVIPGTQLYLRTSGDMDCRTHNGRAIVKFKHELNAKMRNTWRGPDHAAALLMGHIAQASKRQGMKWFDREGVSCIAEYYLSESGTELLVECRDEAYQPAPLSQCNSETVDPNKAGRMIITVYDQEKINRFYERVEPDLKVFCQVVQRLMVCSSWQQSFFRFADQGRLQIWYDKAKLLDSPPV